MFCFSKKNVYFFSLSCIRRLRTQSVDHKILAEIHLIWRRLCCVISRELNVSTASYMQNTWSKWLWKRQVRHRKARSAYLHVHLIWVFLCCSFGFRPVRVYASRFSNSFCCFLKISLISFDFSMFLCFLIFFMYTHLFHDILYTFTKPH